MDCRMHTSLFGTQEVTGICTSTSDATVQRFPMDTDASGEGLGAVLFQIIAGQERVVANTSKTLIKTVRKYCATCHEMLVTHHFRLYLYGHRFMLCIDQSAFQWLHSFKEPEGQVAWWLEQLAEYD